MAVFLLLPLLVGLGAWQLARAEEKRVLLAADARQQALPPQPLEQVLQGAAPGGSRVRLEGRFDADHALLLDNRTRDGRPGVELLQPFHDAASQRWVLVNRGWLPWTDRRVPVAFDTPPGPQALTVDLYRPPGQVLELRQVAGEGWPRLVNRVDAPALWAALGRDGVPLEARLEGGPAAYRVGWPTVSLSPETHVGYAVQWFAMAAALLALYCYLGIRRAREVVDEPQPVPL